MDRALNVVSTTMELHRLDRRTACERSPPKCHNCGSKDHFLHHCPLLRQDQSSYEGSRGGRNGRGGRHGRVDNVMASTTMSQRQIVDQIEHLLAQLASLQAGSLQAMSGRARGRSLHKSTLQTCI